MTKINQQIETKKKLSLELLRSRLQSLSTDQENYSFECHFSFSRKTLDVQIKEKSTGQEYNYLEEGLVDVSNQQYPITADELFYIIATKYNY